MEIERVGAAIAELKGYLDDFKAFMESSRSGCNTRMSRRITLTCRNAWPAAGDGPQHATNKTTTAASWHPAVTVAYAAIAFINSALRSPRIAWRLICRYAHGALGNWRIVLTLLLLATWLPTTAHCGLEAFEVLPMEDCCKEQAQGSHHCDRGCGVVEDGGVKTECLIALPVPPDTFEVFDDLARAAIILLYDPGDTAISPRSEAQFLPQFVMQTALPARAPSFAR